MIGLATCRYATRRPAAHGCSGATVTINTAPQAFTDFDRWVVETAQNSSARGPAFAPVEVDGIGVEADWVPGTRLFETAEPGRWVVVSLVCPADPQASDGAAELAATLARIAIDGG